MRTEIIYIADNGKEFKNKKECKIYEEHTYIIKNKLSRIELKNKDYVTEEVLKIFEKDTEFKWVESYGYSLGTFGRAISDCCNGYDKPYISYYNYLFCNYD